MGGWGVWVPVGVVFMFGWRVVVFVMAFRFCLTAHTLIF